jgi:outer membrane protein TolC
MFRSYSAHKLAGVSYRKVISRVMARTAALRADALVLAALLAGCATYAPKPLDSVQIDRALADPSMANLTVRASEIHHPILSPLTLHPELGLTPDEAAVVAVLTAPSLRAIRDQNIVAGAALLQAGLLPNPQLSYNYDGITGGNTSGTVNADGWGLSYDINALIAHNAKLLAARADSASVRLNVAWEEWQVAQAARMAACDLIALRAQLSVAQEIDQRLAQNEAVVRKAVAQRLKTAIDLSAAEAAARDAHAIVLQLQRDLEHQRLQLDRDIGVPPSTQLRIRANFALPTHFDVPEDATLLADLEHRRLDLLALRKGYQSQEQTLRAAVLNQFPRVNLGFNRASDNTGVHTAGVAATIDLPIFDHNQGSIAAERATRQRLYDEYIGRLFDARADIAQAAADLRAINGQIADAQAALPNLRRLVEVYAEAVNHGNADVLSYYVAWNNLAQKNLDLLKLQQQLADTRVALELAAGRYFPDAPIAAPATQPVRAKRPIPKPMQGPATQPATQPRAPSSTPATAPTLKAVKERS